MRLDRLDLNLLVALDVLIEERSVSQAASRLFLSQPALSGALSRLRDYFGDDLLVQNGRQMVLTAKGEILGNAAREALMLIRAKITTPFDFDPATAVRSFAIMASDYAYDVLLGNAIRKAAKMAPNVSFDIVPNEATAAAQLDRGEIDLFITLSTHLDDKHPRMSLFSDEHAVICWSEGAHRDGIGLTEYQNAGHAVVHFGNNKMPAFTESYLALQGMNRRIEVRLPTFGALPAAVIGTDRVAIMYRRHALHLARHLPIRVYPVPLAMPDVTEEAQWHSMRKDDGGIRWLLDLLRQEAEAAGSFPTDA